MHSSRAVISHLFFNPFKRNTTKYININILVKAHEIAKNKNICFLRKDKIMAGSADDFT